MGHRAGDTTRVRTSLASRLRRRMWAGAATTSLLCALVAGGLLASSSGQMLPRSAGSPSGTLELAPGTTRLVSLTVNAAPTPPPTPPTTVGTNAKAILGYVVAQLQATTAPDKPSAGHIANAIADLNQAVASKFWVGPDGNHIDDKTGGPVFDRIHDAIVELQAVKKPWPSWVATYVNYLDYSARLIASTLVSDNSCSPKKPPELAAAQKELTNGDSEFDKGHFDEAIGHYKAAWNHADNANGTPCTTPDITLSPAGTLFNVQNMVPGDSSSAPVTVHLTVASGTVTLSETGISSTAGFAHELTLQVVDTTSGKSVYTGALDAMPPKLIDGTSGPNSAWSTTEPHSFTFTVAFPNGASGDNAYQGANAGATFVWSRT